MILYDARCQTASYMNRPNAFNELRMLHHRIK